MSNEANKSSELIISIKDTETGAELEFRVSPEIGYSIKQLLEAINKKEVSMKKSVAELAIEPVAWDSGCRL